MKIFMRSFQIITLVFVFAYKIVFAGNVPDIESLKILDIKTAQQIALKTSPSLEAAQNRVLQAKQRMVQAGSRYWPRVNASASGARIWQSDTILESMGSPEDPEDRFSSGISASWTVFDGFERKFGNLIAKYGHEASLAASNDTRRLLLASVASGFYNAQLARENIAIANANREFNRRQAEDARARQDAGTGSLSDVLNFDIQVNAAKAEVIRAEKEYKTAMFALAALMGIEDAIFPESMKPAALEDETEKELTLPQTDLLIEYAINHRPDILRYTNALNSAKAGICQARAGYWPVISLSGSLNADRNDDPGFNADDIGTSVSLSLSYNLFEGGNTRAKVREAIAGKSEAENNLKAARISVKAQILKSLESLKSDREQLNLQRSNAKLVKQNRDLVEKEYRAGQTSLVRLNEAQRDLIQAQSRLALALVSMRLSWQELYAASGQILEDFKE